MTSDPYQAQHWDETPGKLANYVDVDWDRVLDDALIPTAELLREVPGTHWNTQSGGILIPPPDDGAVEQLWSSALPNGPGTASGSSAQGWQNDPVRRREAEDFAQLVLMHQFRQEGWTVEDRRFGNPFDALATRNGERRFLEAKGTQSSGQGVLVTPGEVAFARAHPGECVMGIVSGIRFRKDRTIDENSYALRLLEWNPALGELMPTGYVWRPPLSED